MICPACGKTNIDASAFCEQCGTRLQAQPATGPGTAAPIPPPTPPPPFPASPVPPPTGVSSGQVGALIANMSLGEKIAGGGAVAAAIGFFLPWITVAGAQASYNGFDLAKSSTATYLILLNVIAAGVLCYLSSQAAPGKKLLYAGYLVFMGAICGPLIVLSLLLVSQLSSIAGFGLWLVGLGYFAIAEGGLLIIRNFSKRTY